MNGLREGSGTGCDVIFRYGGTSIKTGGLAVGRRVEVFFLFFFADENRQSLKSAY